MKIFLKSVILTFLLALSMIVAKIISRVFTELDSVKLWLAILMLFFLLSLVFFWITENNEER
ncbi:hypothetical protein [Listeria ilorinensis]|uniref:hypothetical protein n=1 Tax=Listeria ilorinensis TaxID=2867439 RepID=UPI001EF6A79A|nr:hypothetical protein [Listeria ilorinensis]